MARKTKDMAGPQKQSVLMMLMMYFFLMLYYCGLGGRSEYPQPPTLVADMQLHPKILAPLLVGLAPSSRTSRFAVVKRF